MLKGKRGQSLPMNVVIIGIIVLVVLLLVLVFFVGGFTKVKDTISGLLGGATRGTDVQQAIQFCQGYCDQAQGLSGEALKNSAYCKNAFKVDLNGNGLADRGDGQTPDDDKDTSMSFVRYACGSENGFQKKSDSKSGAVKDLGVACPVKC
ncbi:hypothetical protein HZB00_01075 [Candidatus Woesearchaeota archaeon]|nr:hypothetical protein [Candidatus Woesearchaeota archaeon]